MMPYASAAQERFFHTSAARRAGISKKTVKEFDKASKGLKLPARVAKKKIKLKVDNKMRGALGMMDPKTNKVRINVKAHKGDKRELASTIKHEMMHVTHPKMTERQVYKKTAKTKIKPQEQSALLTKLHRKSVNYKVGGLKRKYKLGRGDQKPGTFINMLRKK